MTVSQRCCFAVTAAALLLFCQGAAWAQATDSAGQKGRWYAAAGAAYHLYFSIDRAYSQIRPAYVAGGYFINPRVAVQAELQYGQRSEERSGGKNVIDGETFAFLTKEKTTSTALTVLCRFSRSRPQRHLQFDWLLGLAWVHHESYETSTRTSATRSESRTVPGHSSTQPHLVGGIGLRYQLRPRLAVGTEVLISKNLRIFPYGVWGLLPGGGATMGITYWFG